MKTRILEGHYEQRESAVLPSLVKAGESLLELGGGLGYTSSLIHKTNKCQSLVVVEAHPDLIPIIKHTHKLNRVSAEVVHGAAAASSAPAEVEFQLEDDFWRSSVFTNIELSKTTRVPTVNVQQLLDEHRFSFLICDIEGAECSLMQSLRLSAVQKIAIEHHPKIVGEDKVQETRSAIEAAGFHRCLTASRRNFDIYLRP
jgi:FkbM family methyltransferase